ncbi:MAG TPA: POTRA domain-containing protein, partial [Polyangiaceae bacterium]|nr:POTRA domain-containing protein [Polyangiaceae bacterium]
MNGCLLLRLWALVLVLWSGQVYAEAEKAQPSLVTSAPKPRPIPELKDFLGLPLRAVIWREQGTALETPLQLRRVRLGEPFSPAVARRAMGELLDTGRYAEVHTSVSSNADGVSLLLSGVTRKVVTEIEISGGLFERDVILDAGHVNPGAEVTRARLSEIAQRLREMYVRRGFTEASVDVDWTETEGASRVILRIDVHAGAPRLIQERRFGVEGPLQPELQSFLDRYDLDRGARADEELLLEADKNLERELRHEGWFKIAVKHRVQGTARAALLLVDIVPEQRYRVRFEGNRTFDSVDLQSALDLANQEQPSEQYLKDKTRAYYVDRGFLDVAVGLDARPSGSNTDLV